MASHRIPAHLLMYSDVAKKRGKFCGKIQTIYLQVRPVAELYVQEKIQILHLYELCPFSPAHHTCTATLRKG